MKHDSRRQGQSLVESLVALTILTTGLVGITTLLTKSIQLNRITSDDTQATYLASEGIEIAKNLIDHDVYAGIAAGGVDSWGACFGLGAGQSADYELAYDSITCAPYKKTAAQAAADHLYVLNLNADPTTPVYTYNVAGKISDYTRDVHVSAPSVNELDVKSTVVWKSGNLSNTVSVEDHFYKWHPSFIQAPSGPSGGGNPPPPGPTSTTNLIPGNAQKVMQVQAIPNEPTSIPGWKWNFDPGTQNGQGTANAIGNSFTISTPTGYSPITREFDATTTNSGGEIFFIHWGDSTTATHFVYDTYVAFTQPANLGYLEMDMNQVLANGNTMIMGVQCGHGSNNSWMVTKIVGGVSGWYNSAIPCDVQTWTPNTWYHVQIATSRDNSGNIFYDWVAVNGVTCYFGSGCSGAPASITATNEERPLGWTVGTLLDNFQLDGIGATDQIQGYAANWTMWYW